MVDGGRADRADVTEMQLPGVGRRWPSWDGASGSRVRKDVRSAASPARWWASSSSIVRGSVAGCTVTGPPAVSILSGKLRGRVASTSNECITLAAPLTGTITIRWKADKATPILQTSSTLGITDVTFGGFAAPWGVSYGQFSLGTSSVTGAFTGGDDGATSSNASLTSQDIVEIVSECASPTGLKKLNLGSGQLKLQ
jgi:hypothetical protein